MKTFIHACDQARKKGIDPYEQWFMVKAILMAKINTDNQKEFATTRSNIYSFRIRELSKYQQN